MAYVTTVEEFIGTTKKGKQLYLETDKYEFCYDIWNYILDFTGYKYSFQLEKLGIEPLAKILKYNFNTGFSNIKNSNIPLETRKNLLIKIIYKKLKAKPSKKIYENISSYFIKKSKEKKEGVFINFVIGEEVIFRHWDIERQATLAGVVSGISKEGHRIYVKPYSFLKIEDYSEEENLLTKLKDILNGGK